MEQNKNQLQLRLHKNRTGKRMTRLRRTALLLVALAALLLSAKAALQQVSSAAMGLLFPDTATSSMLTQPDVNSISVTLTAKNAYVINVDTNSVLYEKNGDDLIAPASTTKLLTALTALDYYVPEDTVSVGTEIEWIASNSSRAWLNTGDILTFRQLLTAMLLPSGNDAAYTMAVGAGRKIAGDDGLSIEQALAAFTGAMNQKAAEIGATSSYFVTPDGYDTAGQYTTARDLVLIARECMSHDLLMEAVGSYTIYDVWPSGRAVIYYNTNELLNPDSDYYYPGATGLKTGRSTRAGGCLISTAQIDGQTYLSVVMNSTSEGRFKDTVAIYQEIELR